MYGAKSYTEGYKELDNICNALYGSLPLVSEARSVKLNDVNQITGITSDDKIKEVNLDAIYGGKQYGEAYSFSNHYTPESWLNGKQETTVSGNVNGYYYSINAHEEGEPTATVSDPRQYDMLFKNVEYPSGAQYWLASRGVGANSSRAIFGPGMVGTGDGLTVAGLYAMFLSADGYEFGDWAGVRPVVILDSEVTTDQIHKIEDQTDPVWNYEFEEGGGMGIINIIKNIKQIHPKDVILVNLGKFYYAYGKDSYILSYIFKYKLTYIEQFKVYSCAFPKQSLPKVQATLDNSKINYLIVDKRKN